VIHATSQATNLRDRSERECGRRTALPGRAPRASPTKGAGSRPARSLMASAWKIRAQADWAERDYRREIGAPADVPSKERALRFPRVTTRSVTAVLPSTVAQGPSERTFRVPTLVQVASLEVEASRRLPARNTPTPAPSGKAGRTRCGVASIRPSASEATARASLAKRASVRRTSLTTDREPERAASIRMGTTSCQRTSARKFSPSCQSKFVSRRRSLLVSTLLTFNGLAYQPALRGSFRGATRDSEVNKHARFSDVDAFQVGVAPPREARCPTLRPGVAARA
jgi:hypothetical protein